jgi:UDP-N-acetylmuramoyl-tripeptide--D-alanyl-D-alanine ligase
MVNILLHSISALIIGTLFLISVLRLLMFLQMLQLEGYKTERFIKWMLNNRNKIFSIGPVKDPKKKLVFTARATRLFVLSLILLTFIAYNFSNLSLYNIIFASLLIVLFSPILILLSNILIYPIETIISGLYLKSAKKKINKLKPKVIAITGSYGKTSTKDILFHILSAKYKVLKTPGSFNTTMGLCKVIRGELEPEHKIFIVEMGARKRGDVRELCELVRPEIGIITAIGPQHLETFRTIENVMNAKYELIESLPQHGIAVFNADDERCKYLAQKTKDIRVLLYGITETKNKLYLSAKDIVTDNQGIHFLAQNSRNSAVPYSCRLLGRHNVHNILAATTVALELGISLYEIAEAIKTLEQIPHRLQVISGAGGIIIIDDAFNANPIGAKIALEVLNEFKGGKKVLVTPGLVELGEREHEENKQIGIAAAKVCDCVFLIGPKRTMPIVEGLKEAGFPESNIFIERSLNSATEKFKHLLKVGDIVLFENDLPDTYNE